MATLAGNALGRRGEELAAAHLESLGLVVLARNWRCSEGELDIIATDALRHLIICEVKTRSGDGYGTPAEAVTQGKRRKLRGLAVVYQSTVHLRFVSVRFDVIGVMMRTGEKPELSHIEAAF
jgi:putative endonuclease